MTTIKVSMLAFGNGEVREVDVPDDEWEKADGYEAKAELVFHYGQNDFQPRPFPSVSVDDVIHLPVSDEKTKNLRVDFIGFSEMESADFVRYFTERTYVTAGSVRSMYGCDHSGIRVIDTDEEEHAWGRCENCDGIFWAKFPGAEWRALE